MTCAEAVKLLRFAEHTWADQRKNLRDRHDERLYHNVLLETDGSEVRFTGTDGRGGFSCAWSEGFSSVAPLQRVEIHPHALREVLACSDGKPLFGVTPENVLVVVCGPTTSELRGGDASGFPEVPATEGPFCELSSADLATLERVAASCAKQDLPGMGLGGQASVHLIAREETTLVCGTDEGRLAFCRRGFPWGGGDPPAAVAVPASALRMLHGAPRDPNHAVILVAGAERLSFTNGCFSLTVPAPGTGAGEKVAAFLAKLQPFKHTAGCDASELRAVLLRAKPVARRDYDRVTLEQLPNGDLGIAAECDHNTPAGLHEQATFMEDLDAECFAKRALPVSVNLRWLLGCLPKTGAVILGFQDQLVAVVSDDEDPEPLTWLMTRMLARGEVRPVAKPAAPEPETDDDETEPQAEAA